jgi:hypothetical protein
MMIAHGQATKRDRLFAAVASQEFGPQNERPRSDTVIEGVSDDE